MRSFSILLSLLLFTLTTYAQTGIDTIYIHQGIDTIYVFNKNISSNCGSSFQTSVSLVGDSIEILETDTSHTPLRCMCYFDVSVTLVGLNPGIYHASIFRHPMNDDSIYFIGTKTFSVQQQTSPSFSSHTEFSSCHSLTSISGETPDIPQTFTLLGNYPNPFNPLTVIRYQVHRQSRVKLDIFDELGRFLLTLVDQEKSRGDYEVPWNASHFSSGLYLCKLTTGNEIQTHKMTLLK